MKYTLLTLFFCLCLWSSGFAQGSGNSAAIDHLEIGVSYLVTKAQFSQNSQSYIYDNFVSKDTTFLKNIKPKSGFGFFIGTSIPFADIGERGAMCLSIAAMVNMISWEYQQTAYLPYGAGGFIYGPGKMVDANTMQAGLPIGVDIKMGADAKADRSKRTCMTFGTGFNPYMSTTTYDGESSKAFRVHPYLKAELGLVAGICIKVRALYTFGSVKYLSYSDRNTYPTYSASNQTNFTGKSNLALSFIFMPMSARWSKKAWWR